MRLRKRLGIDSCFVLQVANEIVESMNLKPQDVYLGQGKQLFEIIDGVNHLYGSEM